MTISRQEKARAMDPPRLSRLWTRLHERRFWVIQGLLLVVTAFHGLVEYGEAGNIHGFLEGAQILPVQLYIVPILLAAYWYGIEGGVMTGLFGLLLSIPNLLLWHSSGTAWLGEIVANAIALAVGLLVGTSAEKALAAREARASLEHRLTVLQHLSISIGHPGDVQALVAVALDEMLRVPGLNAVLFIPGSDFDLGEAASAGDPDFVSRLGRLMDSPGHHVTPSGDVLSVEVRGTGGNYGMLAAGFSSRGPGDSDSEFLANVSHALASAIDTASLRQRTQDELRRYARGVTQAQEAERRRIARELHDEAAQEVVKLVRGLGRLADESPVQVSSELSSLRDAAQALGDSLRRTSKALRPPMLDELGLVPALKSLIQQLPIGEDTAQLTVVGEEERLDPELELVVFRLAQEALTNVAKHASALNAFVTIVFEEDRLRLEVSDDGHGFDISEAMQSDRLGLIGMRERAHAVGGTLTVSSQPSAGTEVTFETTIVKTQGASKERAHNREIDDEPPVPSRRRA